MKVRAVQHWLRQLAVVSLRSLAIGTFCCVTSTAAPQQADAQSTKLAEYLWQASPAELGKYVNGLRQMSRAEVASWTQYERLLAGQQERHPTLSIDSPLPDFALKGVDGKIRKAGDYRASPVLVVMFIANHCPASQLYERREKKLFEDYATRGVAFVAIQSNSRRCVLTGEMAFSSEDASFDGMVVHAAYRKFPFPYLYDCDEQSAANRLGPKVTSHILILDQHRKLRYEGRVDDNVRESKANTHEARDAIDALLGRRPVLVEYTPDFGCSMKWNSPALADSVQRELKGWRAKPVKVKTVTLERLKQLRANSTGNTLMINFSATWCGPCRAEDPQLLTIYLWYRGRGLDFIFVSVDSSDSRMEVLKFLQDMHSAIRNLHADSEDTYGTQTTFDPAWKSGVPFNIVLAPGGNVVYRHEGDVEICALRRAILANLPYAGPYTATDY
jgi:thiol-disulfide isomerase/thioredoxin